MKSESKLKRGLLIAAIVCACCAALLALEYNLYINTLFEYDNPLEAYFLPETFTKNGQMPGDITYGGKTYRYNTDIIPILLLGIDKTDQREMQGVGYCADVQLLLAVNKKDGAVKAISIPRDTLTDVPVFALNKAYAYTDRQPITLIHGFAQDLPIRGDLSMAGVSNLLSGIPVTRYISFDIDGITPIVDAVGGVELDLIDDFTAIDDSLQVGARVKIQGALAESYLRDRQLPGMSGQNLDRMARQSQFVPAFLSTLKGVIKDDPSKVRDVLEAVRGHMETNLTPEEAAYLALLVRNADMGLEDIKLLPGEMEIDEVNAYGTYAADQDALTRLVLDTFFTEMG